jgi:hypothetical protein
MGFDFVAHLILIAVAGSTTAPAELAPSVANLYGIKSRTHQVGDIWLQPLNGKVAGIEFKYCR